jgi:hypothetical protein
VVGSDELFMGSSICCRCDERANEKQIDHLIFLYGDATKKRKRLERNSEVASTRMSLVRQLHYNEVAVHVLSRYSCCGRGGLHCLARFQTQKIQTADSLSGI